MAAIGHVLVNSAVPRSAFTIDRWQVSWAPWYTECHAMHSGRSPYPILLSSGLHLYQPDQWLIPPRVATDADWPAHWWESLS